MGSFLSHGLSLKGDGVGVVYEPVKQGVGECGVSDELVPVLGGELCGDEGALAVVAVFDNLEEVFALFVRQGGRCPSRRG